MTVFVKEKRKKTRHRRKTKRCSVRSVSALLYKPLDGSDFLTCERARRVCVFDENDDLAVGSVTKGNKRPTTLKDCLFILLYDLKKIRVDGQYTDCQKGTFGVGWGDVGLCSPYVLLSM